MRRWMIWVLAAALVGAFAACKGMNDPPEVAFTDYMKRAVQAQLNFKAQNGFWAGDRDKDGHIGDTGFGDGDSVHVLRSHSLNFTLTLGGSTFLFRYGFVQGRGNAAYAIRGQEAALQEMTPEEVAYCRYLDKSVDGLEDGESGRVLAFSLNRVTFNPGAGTFESSGMPQSWDAGSVGACAMLLE